MPLTVGGGIRGFTDAGGRRHSALDVAAEYFRSGADKVSIGGDAVEAALEFRATGVKTGRTAIEQISWVCAQTALPMIKAAFDELSALCPLSIIPKCTWSDRRWCIRTPPGCTVWQHLTGHNS